MAKPNRRKRMSRRHGKRGKCWSRRHGRAFKKACGKRSSSWKSRKSANANGISDKVKPKKPVECKQDEIHEGLVTYDTNNNIDNTTRTFETNSVH